MIYNLSKHTKRHLTKDETAELIIYMLVPTIICARIFYVVVYNFAYYLSNPVEILMLWKGGLSFHGGFIGAIIGGYFFCRKKKIRFYQLADIAVIPLSLALFFGRIGNFLNQELYGRVTSVPWAVKFRNAEGFRHPSQLYEAIKNIVIFFVLLSLYLKKKLKEGAVFWLFVTSYSFLRFFIEFFREPDPQLGYILLGLTMGQVICIIMFIVGAIFLVNIFKRK